VTLLRHSYKPNKSHNIRFEMKITYEPINEIIVKEIAKHKNIEDLLYIAAQLRATGQPIALNWAEGIVFTYVPLPPSTEELMEEFLKGRIYYLAVNFAIMEKYQPALVYKREQQYPVPVINVSSSDMLSELAKWLKDWKP
jgi:hypothetical protein